jgi:Na+/phosphate symporter
LDNIQLQSATLITSFIEGLFEPIAGLISGLLPDWGVFLVGLGIMMVSFQLFDKCLPQMTLKESHVGWMSRLVYRPVVMLGLGALVTLVSMSVSLSLSILVPLSNRGFVRRENVIPYIMGANITTFIDTLLAAVLLQNTQAFSIVFSGMLSITIISLLILVIIYKQYQIFLLRSITWIFQKNQNLIIFLLLIFIIPIILLLL